MTSTIIGVILVAWLTFVVVDANSDEKRDTVTTCSNHPDGYCVNWRLPCPLTHYIDYTGCGRFNSMMCCYPKSNLPTLKPATSRPTSGTSTSSGFAESSSSPFSRQCGRPTVRPDLSGRVVGGQSTTIEANPWQILIRKRLSAHCGGSLISEKWVLTAAHCLIGHSGLDVAVAVTNSRNFQHSQIRSIAGQIFHPFPYRKGGPDIALIKLSNSVNLNTTRTRAICLPETTDTFESKTCIVSGWGATSEGGYGSPNLRHVSVPMVTRTTCEFYMGYVAPWQICAGQRLGGKDSCQGDSGGPIICESSDGHWIQAGVISSGHGCGRPATFGLYTDIAQYRNWINAQVRQNS